MRESMDSGLVAYFDLIWESVDGPAEFRALVFNLASSGSLAPQIASEAHPAELLDLIDETEHRHPDKSSWLRLELSSCADIYNGNSTSSDEKASMRKNPHGLAYIATQDLGYGFQPINYDTGLRVDINKSKFKIAPPDSLLICLEGGSAGKKMGIVEKAICFGNKLFAVVCKSWIDPKFLMIYFLSTSFQNDFRAQIRGIIGGISKLNFSAIDIPVPPLPEQQRIVETVDYLLSLCDALEERRLIGSNLCSRSWRSAIHSVSIAEKPEELKRAWERIERNWELLFTSREPIETVRTLVLDLAVRGELAPEEHSGISARDQIAESTRFAKKKKRDKPHENIEPPFEIPGHWMWATIADMCDTQTGSTPKILDSDEANDAIHYVTASDMVKMRARPNNFVPVSSARRSGRIASKGSVLFVGIGATIGKSCLITSPATFNQQIHSATPRVMNAEYLSLVLASGYFQKICRDRTNATAIPILNKTKWETIPIPIPPLAEQSKIVENVKSLFDLCDQLESVAITTASIAASCARSVLLSSA